MQPKDSISAAGTMSSQAVRAARTATLEARTKAAHTKSLLKQQHLSIEQIGDPQLQEELEVSLVEDKAISEVEAISARGDGLGQRDHGSQAYRTARMDVAEMTKQVQPDICTIVVQMLQKACEKEESVRKEAREEAKWIHSEAHGADSAAPASYCYEEGADKDQDMSKARHFRK